MSGGQMSDILDRIAEHTRHHRTTLVFVDTRKMAERRRPSAGGAPRGERGGGRRRRGCLAARRRASRQPLGGAAAHRRTRLRAGDLRALVATASLELGIDVGPVELVCQIGSPRAIGTFLQRVGRANHHRDGTPAGRLYPTTRDELVECTALLAAVREGRLDLLEPPVDPARRPDPAARGRGRLHRRRGVEANVGVTRHAAPYAELLRAGLRRGGGTGQSGGIETGRGRRGAHLHLDTVNGRFAPGGVHAWPR